MRLLRIQKNRGNYPLQLSFYFLITSWTIIISGIVAWSYKTINEQTVLLAQREAYKGFEKDVTFRAWASMHGGVYVPVTKETPPNPFLTNIKERDITTPSNRKLTLMNPAFITRQVHELSYKQFGIIGHITSLKPIRKENAPDKWEINALNEFEKGAEEFYGFDFINSQKYFRFMGPLITTSDCLKCHEAQGYKVGEIRGGLSSSIPWKQYQQSIISQTTNLVAGYGILWVIGFIGLLIVKKRFFIYITRRNADEKEMHVLNEELQFSKNVIEENLFEKNIVVEELTDTKEKLEKINSEKDKFFSIIAHDLRSPFQGFIGMTEIMADGAAGFTPAELATFGKEMNQTANNLYKLLLNLLDWARMQRGEINFAPQEYSLLEIVTDNFKTIEQRAVQKRIALINTVPKTIKIFADEKMINSVIRNLLSNSVKFSRAEGKVIVSAREIDNNLIEISVADSGIGMTEVLRKKLFKMEEKVGRRGTEDEESTGLGLLLCKEFVEKHNGKIWAESEVENLVTGKVGGSTFLFTIPGSNLYPDKN